MNSERSQKKNGGALLSKTYRGSSGKLRWACMNGHQWEAHPLNIKNGTWCPYCYGNVKKSIKDVEEIANDRGFELLSSEYRGTNGKLRWRCTKGHEWSASPRRVAGGTGCPKCAGNILGINDVSSFALEHGCVLKSQKYKNNRQKLVFSCREGHEFEMSWAYFKRMGARACPICRAGMTGR